MAARMFEDVQSKDFIEIKEVLEAYAKKCQQMADALKERTVTTDGLKNFRKGMFSLRNVLAKQLGMLSVEEPHVVATWSFRSKASKAQKIVVRRARSDHAKSRRNDNGS